MSKRKPFEPVGTIVRRLGVVQTVPKVPSAAQRDLVEQGVSIFQETPSAQEEGGFRKHFESGSSEAPNASADSWACG